MLGSDYHVLSPEMPEPEHPEYTHWKRELDKDLALLRGDAILVGHSLGGSVLLKYLSEQPLLKSIAGLFIVAAPFWGAEHWDVDEYRLTENFNQYLPSMSRLVLYHSRNDKVVPFSHLSMYATRLPGATFRETRGQHLFHNGLPELITDIKTIPFASNHQSAQLRSATLSPYLRFSGQCREAMNFYKDCLGGELTLLAINDSAMKSQYSAATHHHILHACLIKNNLVLFAADVFHPDGVKQGNSVSLVLNCSSEEEINTYFNKLSKGARITQELCQQPGSSWFATLIDKYGIDWTLNFGNARYL
jgi:uncharacterized glyoxalase superfamily protein PhnB/predicted alpha/beta hydrolase family esterase